MHHLSHVYIHKWFACETPQRGGGWGHHPLLGVSSDWVEPSDSRRPEERLLRGSAGGHKPHTSHRAALLEQQVSTSDAAYPLASTCLVPVWWYAPTGPQSWIVLEVCAGARNYSNFRTPVLSSEKWNLGPGALFLFLCCAWAAELVLMWPTSTTFIICFFLRTTVTATCLVSICFQFAHMQIWS